MPLPRLLPIALFSLLSLFCILAALVYALTWRPAQQEIAAVECRSQAPLLQPGQALKLMTWNIQYLAGKNHVFWYDLEGGSGPDLRPSSADLAFTLDEVVRVVRDEQADIVLLQELHDGARASDYQDQLGLLQARLRDLYPCSTQAFYWKAGFVPHPKILGSVGMKLATLSRPLLVSSLPLRGGGELAAINTHLDAFAQGDDTMQQQVTMTGRLLDQLQGRSTPWVLGGDFNLLPPGQYRHLPAEQRGWYAARSELQQLAARYPMIPNTAQASGPGQAAWYTHAPNSTGAPRADRTLDYLFHSPQLTLLDAQVRQHDTLKISDHLPLLARLLLPALD